MMISRTDDDIETKKAKGLKRCIVKPRIMFENYKDSLFNNKTILRSRQRFKSDHHNVYTENVNKIALNDVYKNIIYYNPDKENKILILFDDMIADMIQNKKVNSKVTELFIRGRKLNISLVFII